MKPGNEPKMRQHDHAQWQHGHRFETGHEEAAERRTRLVLMLTFAMMVVEIVTGYWFHSMALTADGWHMSTHAGAMAIATLAYVYARRKAGSRTFTFGTGKVGALAAYTSAIVLSLIAALVVWQSVEHLLNPQAIAFDQAIPIAVVGLAVNVASAWILGGAGHEHGHDHGHDHVHDHDRGHAHHDHVPGDERADLNLRAAYVHVLADAVTSVLAIVALLLVKFAGWTFMDPAMGIVGAGVIANWSYGLIRQSSRTLLDLSADRALEAEVRAAIEGEGDNEISDLHLWKIGPAHYGAIVSVVTHHPQDPDHYKALLKDVHELGHVTVEVHACREPA